jgi:hypothetical protein
LGVNPSPRARDQQVIVGQNPVPVEVFWGLPSELDNARLEGRPVVVLSNNDGCLIARSNEAKALGLTMGNLYHLHRLPTTVLHTPLPHVTCVISWSHHHAAGWTDARGQWQACGMVQRVRSCTELQSELLDH